MNESEIRIRMQKCIAELLELKHKNNLEDGDRDYPEIVAEVLCNVSDEAFATVIHQAEKNNALTKDYVPDPYDLTREALLDGDTIGEAFSSFTESFLFNTREQSPYMVIEGKKIPIK